MAAMILIGRLGAGKPHLGNPWELGSIAAAATGGASLMGGIVGTLIGALVRGAMRNGCRR